MCNETDSKNTGALNHMDRVIIRLSVFYIVFLCNLPASFAQQFRGDRPLYVAGKPILKQTWLEVNIGLASATGKSFNQTYELGVMSTFGVRQTFLTERLSIRPQIGIRYYSAELTNYPGVHDRGFFLKTGFQLQYVVVQISRRTSYRLSIAPFVELNIERAGNYLASSGSKSYSFANTATTSKRFPLMKGQAPSLAVGGNIYTGVLYASIGYIAYSPTMKLSDELIDSFVDQGYPVNNKRRCTFNAFFIALGISYPAEKLFK